MFIGALFGDILVFRMLFILLASSLTFLKGKKNGYISIDYRTSAEIKQMHLATTKLMTLKKKSKMTGGLTSTLIQKHLQIPSITVKNMKTDRSEDNMLASENQYTQNNHDQYEGGEESMNQSGIIKKYESNIEYPMLNRSQPSIANQSLDISR